MMSKNYWKWGLTIFCSLSGVAAVCFALLRFESLVSLLSYLSSALSPVWTGMAIAYLLCPVAQRLETQCQKALPRFARLVSVLLTLLLSLAVLAFFSAMVVPQLVRSVGGLAADLPGLLEEQYGRLRGYLSANSDTAQTLMDMVESVEDWLVSWIRSNLFSTVSSFASQLQSIGSAILNIVVAVIVAVYLLLDRERYLAQCRKLFCAVSRNPRVNRNVAESLARTDRIFRGFLSGKLFDSLIIGIICLVCLLVLRMPYALLISVIVGVTNIIPMFGPFIGAVPSAFLLLLISPRQCFVFLVFIVILQQVDGNIIGPRILGDATGLSALYVTVAMLLFGKLLGFLGMIVGVPLFAALYDIVKRSAEYALHRRGLPEETDAYRAALPAAAVGAPEVKAPENLK